jgi:hypothetical protein
MRYRWSRKPPASFISLIFSTPLLMVSSRTSHRRGMRADSTALGAAVAKTTPRVNASVAMENRGGQWILVGIDAIQSPNTQSVDSGCEPTRRPHAPRRHRGRRWDRGVGAGRPAPQAATRALPRLRRGLSWSSFRLRGTRRRGRRRASSRVVRNRDGSHDRDSHDRGSVRRTESSDGISDAGP